MNPRPIFVNQKEAAEMLGISVRTFCRLKSRDHRLMPAVIPATEGLERYLVSDLEEWARWVKYPHSQNNGKGEMWGDESAA